MTVLKHTKIYIKPIARNGSDYFGVKAYCDVESVPGRFFEVAQYGETAAIAKSKLLEFLRSDGEYTLEQIV